MKKKAGFVFAAYLRALKGFKSKSLLFATIGHSSIVFFLFLCFILYFYIVGSVFHFLILLQRNSDKISFYWSKACQPIVKISLENFCNIMGIILMLAVHCPVKSTEHVEREVWIYLESKVNSNLLSHCQPKLILSPLWNEKYLKVLKVLHWLNIVIYCAN